MNVLQHCYALAHSHLVNKHLGRHPQGRFCSVVIPLLPGDCGWAPTCSSCLDLSNCHLSSRRWCWPFPIFAHPCCLLGYLIIGFPGIFEWFCPGFCSSSFSICFTCLLSFINSPLSQFSTSRCVWLLIIGFLASSSGLP